MTSKVKAFSEITQIVDSVIKRWEQVPDCTYIGSRCLLDATEKNGKHSKEILERTDNFEKRDLDLATKELWAQEDKDNFKSLHPGKRIEFHVIPPLFENDYNLKLQPETLLFTLKASHIFWHPTKFGKTLYDLILLKKETNAEIHEELFDKLYEFWSQKFGENKRQDFEKSNEEFFDDAVQREISHDELHLQIAKKPAYLLIVNESSPKPIQSKFEALSDKDKLQVIVEEAIVLALERFYPSKIKNLYIAYRKGIYLLIKRLAPLWMAKWMINNIDLVFKEENVIRLAN